MRKEWGQEEFHFLAVMLPRFGRIFSSENRDHGDSDNFSWAWFREAQMEVLNIPNTAVANTIDLGDAKNIYPKWHPSIAKIVGGALELQSGGVKDSVAVRYAFAGFPVVNLVNSAGLPAYPFRSDTWKRE